MTGFALLISAFVMSYSSEPLSAYLWFLVVSLAWFSAATHLAGLSIIRSYLHQHPWTKAARVSLMFLLLVLLTVAFVPTGFFSWVSVYQMSVAWPASPAVCYFSLTNVKTLWNYYRKGFYVTDEGSLQMMILGVLLLHFGFASRCIKLFRPLSNTMNRVCRQPLSKFLRKILQGIASMPLKLTHRDTSVVLTRGPTLSWHRAWIDMAFVPLFGFFLTLRFLTDLYSSMLSEASYQSKYSINAAANLETTGLLDSSCACMGHREVFYHLVLSHASVFPHA